MQKENPFSYFSFTPDVLSRQRYSLWLILSYGILLIANDLAWIAVGPER